MRFLRPPLLSHARPRPPTRPKIVYLTLTACIYRTRHEPGEDGSREDLRGSRILFQKNEYGVGFGGGAAALVVPVALPADRIVAGWRARFADWSQGVDFAPDLGRNIGSLEWWRGLATCSLLCGTMLLAAPGTAPLPGRSSRPLASDQFEQMRSQMITPLALGADTGSHMGPTGAVLPLAQTPERPTVDLDAVIGIGDSFGRMLRRAGVGSTDAREVERLIGTAVNPDSIEEGTRIHITLGRRQSRLVPRPVDALSVRARLDLALELRRTGSVLGMTRVPIAVDDTPLRIRGRIGGSLYASARAAGADPRTVQSYLKVLSRSVPVENMRADDRFDIIVAHRRAATGESETGDLLFAGLDRAVGKPVALMRWSMSGRDEWLEANGMGERKGMLTAPVAGHLTSGFGMRFHPLLGYTRMHQGVDFGAPTGTPIYAAAAGVVTYSGRHGGHGNYVRLDHGGGLGTGYAHMSRIVARPGEMVRQGEIIGYVGSTGLSTGPHLHYEVYKGGVTVNPMSIRFSQQVQLAGAQLGAFKARLARLRSLPDGVPNAFAGSRLASAGSVGAGAAGATSRLR